MFSPTLYIRSVHGFSFSFTSNHLCIVSGESDLTNQTLDWGVIRGIELLKVGTELVRRVGVDELDGDS